MTFLGIADTLQGDLTGYIPSNLISICDGLVNLSTAMFSEGMRPAVDYNMSLSVVGGRAQPPLLRELSSNLRRNYLEYTEVARLSKLQSGMSKEAEAVMKRGQVLVAMMQQSQQKPAGLAEELLILYALRSGTLQDLDSTEWTRFRGEIGAFAHTKDPELGGVAEAATGLTPELESRLNAILVAFFRTGG
jgi:F-type H+-transporting ATPase subunit alpha